MLSRLNAYMDVRPRIALIEAGLIAAGIPVARLYSHANINGSTWVRWKQGAGARAHNWHKVEVALTKHAPAVSEALLTRFGAVETAFDLSGDAVTVSPPGAPG